MGSTFDVVIKVRPDDLWFGPFIPYCALQRRVAYLSRQKERFSDQFFVIPRELAERVLTMVFRMAEDGLVQCASVEGEPLGQEVVLLAGPENFGQRFHFEDNFYTRFQAIAHNASVSIKLLALPRALSREGKSKDDMIEKVSLCMHGDVVSFNDSINDCHLLRFGM